MEIQRSILRSTRALFSAALLCSLFFAVSSAGAQQPYKVLDQWKLADAADGITCSLTLLPIASTSPVAIT